MAERPLTERQEQVLVILLDHCEAGYGMTGNEIGSHLDLPPAYRRRGPWAGNMGAAQRVISALTGLGTRGLVRNARRRDGMSGSATALTETGVEHAVKLKRERG